MPAVPSGCAAQPSFLASGVSRAQCARQTTSTPSKLSVPASSSTLPVAVRRVCWSECDHAYRWRNNRWIRFWIGEGLGITRKEKAARLGCFFLPCAWKNGNILVERLHLFGRAHTNQIEGIAQSNLGGGGKLQASLGQRHVVRDDATLRVE